MNKIAFRSTNMDTNCKTSDIPNNWSHWSSCSSDCGCSADWSSLKEPSEPLMPMKTLGSSGFCATMHVLFVWVYEL